MLELFYGSIWVMVIYIHTQIHQAVHLRSVHSALRKKMQRKTDLFNTPPPTHILLSESEVSAGCSLAQGQFREPGSSCPEDFKAYSLKEPFAGTCSSIQLPSELWWELPLGTRARNPSGQLLTLLLGPQGWGGGGQGAAADVKAMSVLLC